MNIIQKAKAIFDKINNIMMGLSAVIVVSLGVVITVDVLRRAILGDSWQVLFEITQWTLVWMVFLGTAWLLKENGHIHLDLLVSHLKPRHQAITEIATSIFCAILLAFITFYGFKLVVFDYQSGNTLYSLLKPPKWILEVIIPIGCLMLTIQFLFRIYENVMKFKGLTRGTTTQADNLPGGEH